MIENVNVRQYVLNIRLEFFTSYFNFTSLRSCLSLSINAFSFL